MRDRFKSRFIVFGFIILFLRPHRSFLGLRLPRICFQSELESDRERERESEKEREKSTGHSGTVKACGGGFNCALFIFLIYD